MKKKLPLASTTSSGYFFIDKMINKIMNNTRNKGIIKSTIISPPFGRVTNRLGHPAHSLYKVDKFFQNGKIKARAPLKRRLALNWKHGIKNRYSR